jgi:hypothetical protein
MIYISDLYFGFSNYRIYLFMTSFEQSLYYLSHNNKYSKLHQWHKLHHIDYPPHK